jgi:hypothetical protein
MDASGDRDRQWHLDLSSLGRKFFSPSSVARRAKVGSTKNFAAVANYSKTEPMGIDVVV